MGNTTVELQRWLEVLRSGDERGRRELINHACERLRKLTRRMLKEFPRVGRWEQTDDVLQNALMRLYPALADVTPDSLWHFYSLATLQIRRELLDLARHYLGPEGQAAKHDTGGDECGLLEQPADREAGPVSLSEWTNFHQQAGACPKSGRSSTSSGTRSSPNRKRQRSWASTSAQLNGAGETPVSFSTMHH